MSWKHHVTDVAFRIHLSRDAISHLCTVISSQSLSVTLFLSRLVNISPRRDQLLQSTAIQAAPPHAAPLSGEGKSIPSSIRKTSFRLGRGDIVEKSRMSVACAGSRRMFEPKAQELLKLLILFLFWTWEEAASCDQSWEYRSGTLMGQIRVMSQVSFTRFSSEVLTYVSVMGQFYELVIRSLLSFQHWRSY